MLPSIKSEKIPRNIIEKEREIKLPTISAGLARSNFLYEFIQAEKAPIENNIEKLHRFSRVHSAQQRRRREYFEKRELEAAIQRQIKLHNERVEASQETIQLCQRLTKRFNSDLQKAFASLVEDYAKKSFDLSCTVATLNSEVNRKEKFEYEILRLKKGFSNEMEQLKEKIDDRKWRIRREKERILMANQMLKAAGLDEQED